MAEAKTKPTATSPKEFVAAVHVPQQRADAQELVRIFRRATGQDPVMWGPSIVGFGKYHYRYESGREGDMCLAGFSPRSTALVLYVLSGSKHEEGLLARLGKFKRGKACLYVKRLGDIDRDVLEELVRVSAAHTRETSECGVCAETRAEAKTKRVKNATGKSRRVA